FLFTPYSETQSGPDVTSGHYLHLSPAYTITGSAGTLVMPHAFVPSTTDSNASGKEFWASIKTVVQGWGDLKPRMAGASYGSELVTVKSLGSAGTGSVDDIVRSLEYISNIAQTNNIIAVNLSFSIGNGITSEILKSTVRSLVSNGVAVVVSAGNDQQEGLSVSSPGDENTAITVGAVNDQNQVTSYSSVGSLSSSVTKPDVLAPGGSYITRNYIIAPKSTYIDDGGQWNRTGSSGVVPYDSYALKIGTSQAAPFVTGLIGVMASKKTGGWAFGSNTMPLFYKMLICMTAFETGSRESSAVFVNAPVTPERAGGLKDRVEGYGRIDARGAMSAVDGVVALSALSAPANQFSFSVNVYDQKSFTRAVSLSSSEEYNFSMTVPTGADYDLYLFNGTPDANGEPVLLASSALVNNPVERIIDFIPPSTGTYYLVAKWISGSGTTNFVLESERSKSATPTQISGFRIDRNMRDKIVTVSWKTNVPAISKIQYGSTGGLGSEQSETDYETNHSFSFNIDYDNYYYVRGISSSTGNTDLDISTAVSPVYRTSTFGNLQDNISIEDLPIVPNVGGCGTIDGGNSGFNSGGFGVIIALLPLLILLVVRRRLKTDAVQ
ncbi:MAG: S8 family serine peptidase, partial [Proteobacteria bacterium]|nr:S8 family serine peptidase [Pseudomonadota bacterium]